MANPIWKDYYVNLGTAESVQFRILVGEVVIYTGKAHKRPGQTSILIRINDICADWLQHVFPTLAQKTFTGETPVTFIIQKRVEVPSPGWQILKEVQFDDNWSYDYDYDAATMGMSFPVNGRIDRRQWLVFTAYNASEITAHVKLKSGETYDVILPVAISDDFDSDFNMDFSQSVRSAQTGTAVFDLSKLGDVDTVTIDDRTFKVVSECCKYALYYRNAYGGWDSLLIDGNHSEVDNLTRHTREVEYDNRDVSNRGTINYVNEVGKSFTLHTSWLSDDESSRMHLLLNSPCVYLGDIEKGVMIPVVLTDNTTEYKTYKTNGGKLVNYSINVAVAQERVRR